MFQKIKSALLICLTLIIMISATNTFAQLQDDNGNVGPLRSQKTEPINPLALQTPTPNNTQNTYSIGGNSTFLDVWNEQIAAEKAAQKEAEAARKKEAAARKEERAARINENKIKQQKYEEEVNKTATEAANNFDAQYLEDFGTKQLDLAREEGQLGYELNIRHKEDLKNFGKMNDKEIELKEKGIDPNTDPEYQKLKQNYLDGKQKTEEIEKQLDVLWESQKKLQEKEKESKNSLNFFNNAQNIGNLELMKAANGRVTYQGCTFLGNFDTNSALGSGNNRILQSAICWMQDVSASLGVGMALGAALIKANTNHFWDGVMTIAIGVCMFLAFFLIYLVFPLKLLDAFIRLAFVFALMPLWIILWVFPATAGYTKKAWDTFIGTLFYFISLSIVIALVLILMNESIQTDAQRTAIFNYMLDDRTDKAAELLSFGKTFFLTLAFGLMSYTLLNTAEALSNMFASAPSLGLDKAMTGNATQAYQFTKSAAGTAKRAVTGGAALIGAGIGYARGKFGQKNSDGNAEPADNSTKPASLGKFEGASGSGENAGSQQNNPTFTYTPSSTDGKNGTWSIGSTPSTSTNTGSQPTGSSGENAGSQQNNPTFTYTPSSTDGKNGTWSFSSTPSTSTNTGSQPTDASGENTFSNSSSVDERRRNGVNAAERIHRNATAAQMDKTSKNAYIQKMLDQFYNEELKKGIIYSQEEKHILSRRANGKLSSKDAKKEFNKINGKN